MQSDQPNTTDRTFVIEQVEVAKKAAKTLAEFPLPSKNLTSMENYRRVLDWLYHGEVAALVVGLSYGMKEATLTKPTESTTPSCAELPFVSEREQQCREPYHWDDGTPYCDTCGLHRNTIAMQEQIRRGR